VVVNVAPYQHGVSYGNDWTHIDGWSERVVDYIAAVETDRAEYMNRGRTSSVR
jgi:hypothetical protein